MRWPKIETLTSEHLRLDPLSVDHACEMVGVLADPSLYEYTGGEAPSLEQLQRRYASQAIGRSQNGSEGWFNWIVRRVDGSAPIGFVAHVHPEHLASMAVARNVGLQPTPVLESGEVRWES